MSLEQLYYTSCYTEERSGFQVKARSNGFRDEWLSTVSPVMGYRVVPPYTDMPISRHPVAFRYYPLSDTHAALLTSQSSGTDEQGRPGNYFVHVLAGTISEIAGELPPILYWQSSFWQNQDATSRTTLPSIDSMEAALEVSFNYNRIWDILQSEAHRRQMQRLIQALVDYPHDGQRIILVADSADVAHWIYGASLVLPERYRRELSFTTYHHAPNKSSFVITGTDAHTVASFSQSDYRRYVIIDTINNNMSDGSPSDYTAYAMSFMTDEQRYIDHFNQKFLAWLDEHDHAANPVTPHLNSFSRVYQGVMQSQASADVTITPQDISHLIDTIDRAVQSRIQKDIFKTDCERVLAFLVNQIQHQPDAYFDLYPRTLALYRQIEAPAVIQQQTRSHTVNLFVQAIEKENLDGVKQLYQTLQDVYSPNTLQQAIESSSALNQRIEQLINQASAYQVQIIWYYLMNRLTSSAVQNQLQALLYRRTFDLLEAEAPSVENLSAPLSDTASTLLNMLKKKHPDNPQTLIDEAASYQRNNTAGSVLPRVYVFLVESLSLDQRHTYRDNWQTYREIAPLHQHEIRHDLNKQQNLSARIRQFENWMRHLQTYPAYTDELFEVGLRYLWPALQSAPEHILSLLASDTCASYLAGSQTADLYQNLLTTALQADRIQKPDTARQKIYSNIPDTIYRDLPPPLRATIKGSLVMATRKLPAKPAERDDIHQELKRYPPDDYRKTLSEMLEALFESQINRHDDLVNMLYVPDHRSTFWEIYWQQFARCFLKQGEMGAKLLTFWFESAGNALNESYVQAEFFMNLPPNLEDICDTRDYRTVQKSLLRKIETKLWYKSIEDTLSQSRKRFFGLF